MDKLSKQETSKGAVYTCDFAYELAYDWVYDLLTFVYRPLFWVSDEELVFYMDCVQIAHEIIRGIVRTRIRTRADGP
jgi:hypothetical protein